MMMQRKISLAVMVLAVIITSSAIAQQGYSLMIQQSPPNGGTVNPGTGVHRMNTGGNITLVANPSPGYKFVYWLGDVSEATASETTVTVDAPKMVIAVYERAQFQFNDTSESIRSSMGPTGGGGGPAPTVYPGGGYSGVPSYPAQSYNGFTFPQFPDNPDLDQPESDPFPVPDDGDDEEVPEPATIFMISAGAIFAIRAGNKRKN